MTLGELMGILASVKGPTPPASPPIQPQAAAPPTAPTFQRGSIDLADQFIQYPALRPLLDQLSVVDSRQRGVNDGRQLEWYPPNETDNPRPGGYTAELFKPDMSNAEAATAIAADALHGLKATDPRWAAYRQRFLGSLTQSNKAMDQRAYAEDRAHGETRTFNQWMEDSRGDAYLRGYLFPDKADEWRKGGTYSPQQMLSLEQMRAYLKGR